MTTVNKYWWWPPTMMNHHFAAAGKCPAILSCNHTSVSVTSTSYVDSIDQSSVGSGVIMWLSQDPSTTGSMYTNIILDGTTIKSDVQTAPSGNNYMVGHAWEGADEHNAYVADMLWFESGFKIQCKKSFVGTAKVFCYWYELDWS